MEWWRCSVSFIGDGLRITEWLQGVEFHDAVGVIHTGSGGGICAGGTHGFVVYDEDGEVRDAVLG